MTHAQRIKSELIAAGVTAYGLRKLASRYLPKVIHQDESIQAVAYGRTGSGTAMLIATDKRIMYVDKKPFFSTVDELNYGLVSGVKLNTAGLFSALTLHTRLGDYTLKFVSMLSAHKFISFIEGRRIETGAMSW